MYCFLCATLATPTCAKTHPGERVSVEDAISMGLSFQAPLETKDPTDYLSSDDISITSMNFLVDHAKRHGDFSSDSKKELYFLICQILKKFPEWVLYKNRDVETAVSMISQYGHEHSVDNCSFLHDAVLDYLI
jgi:hypothetical protein